LSRKRIPLAVIFWGVRGSIPAPGRKTLRYGGNTSCVEIRQGRDSLILDGGSGIRLLGGLPRWEKKHSLAGKTISILVSHTHMDHIVGIPFFQPAIRNGQSLKIYGPPGLSQSLRHLFPFPRLQSRKRICKITPSCFRIGPFRVASFWLNHPGRALGYRIATPSGQTVVYMSDHEPLRHFRHHPAAPSEARLLSLIHKADLLILDGQYLGKEYRRHRGWGHSSVPDSVHLSLKGGARRLILFHHDPHHSDAILAKKLLEARRLIARSGSGMTCRLAREGEKIVIN